MIDLVDPSPAVATQHGRRRRTWIILGLSLVVLMTGAITLTAIALRYLHAKPLITSGGAWLPPDDAHARFITAGPVRASVIAPRPGHDQSFYMTLINESDVSQTVLGLQDAKEQADPTSRAEPITLQVSKQSAEPDVRTVPFTSEAVTIPPHGEYALRLTIRTNAATWQGCGRSEYLTELALRVRVGVFTRVEHLDFRNLVMEIRSTC